MSAFDKYIAKEEEGRTAQQSAPTLEDRARAALEEGERWYREGFDKPENVRFRQLLAQGAAYLIEHGVPMDAHYLGIPDGSDSYSAYSTMNGYVATMENGRGWNMQSHEKTYNGRITTSLFLREDSLALDVTDTTPVLPLSRPIAAREEHLVGRVAEHEGALYVSSRQVWQRSVPIAGGRTNDGLYFLRDGELMRHTHHEKFEYDWHEPVSYEKVFAQFVSTTVQEHERS